MTTRLDPSHTQIHETAFVAQGATVLGDVHLGAESTVWFGSVIRGDIEKIRIGARTNIQDLSVVHADAGFPTVVGDDVTVGHRCILHGCTIGKGALIGMGAILMNGAVIGEGSIVGAGTLIPEGKVFPENVLILGSPGRVKRELNETERASLAFSAMHYVENGKAFAAAGHGQPRAASSQDEGSAS